MTNQPSVPGFTARDDEDLTPAPDDETQAREGTLVIQDTEVIDATQADTSAVTTQDEPQD